MKTLIRFREMFATIGKEGPPGADGGDPQENQEKELQSQKPDSPGITVAKAFKWIRNALAAMKLRDWLEELMTSFMA